MASITLGRMPRHASVQQLADLLEPNPNLPDGPMAVVSGIIRDTRDRVLSQVGDGAELSAGLRKLLEAKDCFVRQALIDGRE